MDDEEESQQEKRHVAVHEHSLVTAEFAPLAKGAKHTLYVKEDQDWRKHDLVLVREFDPEGPEGAGPTGKHRLARVTWIDKSQGRARAYLQAGVMAASVRIFREPRSI